MVKPRVPETDHGITGEFDTRSYDSMMRRLRDRGWLETRQVIRSGIVTGLALEVGPGPGYLGLEWLKNTEGSQLRALDISEDMIAIAERNAREYGLSDRVEYVRGDASGMPFEDDYFDAVFTNGSLHEWAHPEAILDEIARVLKPGGRYLVGDMRRDMFFLIKWFLWLMSRPKEIRPYLLTSIGAGYTVAEVEAMLPRTQLRDWKVSKDLIGMTISGKKPGGTP